MGKKWEQSLRCLNLIVGTQNWVLNHRFISSFLHQISLQKILHFIDLRIHLHTSAINMSLMINWSVYVLLLWPRRVIYSIFDELAFPITLPLPCYVTPLTIFVRTIDLEERIIVDPGTTSSHFGPEDKRSSSSALRNVFDMAANNDRIINHLS